MSNNQTLDESLEVTANVEETIIEPTEQPTPEQLAEEETARKSQEEETYGPYRKAASQRKELAAIIAEHDALMAQMLFEATMNGLA